MADAVALTPEDRAILDLEGPAVAGHTCKVLLLDGDPGIDALRARIAARLPAAPMLTWRLGGTAHEPCWVPAGEVDLDRHVTPGPPEPLSGAALRAEIARRFEQRLDRALPLWHLAVLRRPAGPALVWRIHHALADGTTVMRLARELLFDATSAAPPAPGVRHDDAAHRRRSLTGFVEREVARSRDPSPFDGRVGRRREVGFAQVALGPLRTAVKAHCGATVNDAVVALVGGALRRWMLARHGPLARVRVRIPVSLHAAGDDQGNRDSFFCVGLPLDEPDPLARLRAVHAETARCKEEHDAETIDAMLRALRAVSPRLRAFAEHVEADPRSFALNVSNVPGPREAVSVLGAPVPSLFSVAEIGERHALRVAVVSIADRLCFGFCADPAIVDDVQSMADAIAPEAALLVAG